MTLSEEAFAKEALEFLTDHARPKVEASAAAWGEGSDRVNLLAEKTREEEAADLRAAQEWRRTVFDAGFGWITGPPEYGGRGLPSSYERRYQALEAGFDVPSQGPFTIGLGMVAPTILAHATPDVRDAYLRPLWRGDIVACQLFSEPVAGSDLAGLPTRAERDGDEWVLHGPKGWTSGAPLSDVGAIICRTDPAAPKHKGLTAFLVDMHAPGVEVRPLRQMTGGASFNEVFFTDVRVPDSHRLGDVNNGWAVALTTLMNERASIGAGGSVGTVNTARLIALLRHAGRAGDPLARQRLADVYINAKVSSYTSQRALARVKAGQAPGPELSIAKLALTLNTKRVCDLVSAVLGPKLIADGGEWGTYAWSELVLGFPAMRIAGGTDEIMRNIIGERVLGLPKEPR